MLIYLHLPYARAFFYLFTIVFHAFLLARSLVTAKYLLAALLAVPVTAVTYALWKFTRKAVIRIRLGRSGLELDTLFQTVKLWPQDIRIKGRYIEVSDGRRFIINPSKGAVLAENLKKER